MIAWRHQDPWAVLVDSSARKAIYFQDVAHEESSAYGGKKRKTVSWRWVQQRLQTKVGQRKCIVELAILIFSTDGYKRRTQQRLRRSQADTAHRRSTGEVSSATSASIGYDSNVPVHPTIFNL